MHLQLRFKQTHILLQDNNNTNHGSSSKISTHNPTSQILKKITSKTIGLVKLQNFIRVTQLAKFYPKAWQKH